MKQVLVVEDDPAWQQVLSEILADMDLAVDATDNLGTALSWMGNGRYQLAVVDLCLGGEDHHNQEGLRVLEALREKEPGCVSILLTGLATPEQMTEVLSQGEAYACLRKENFRRSEFRKLVDQALWPEQNGSFE